MHPPRDPVTLTFDGEAVVAERGEPVAAALVAAGKIAIARSAKFHRPRGPACMRAACDGCLARVDDRPNVMTCAVAAEDRMVVSSQNTLGSRNVDLLRVTDWFFPDGMNHHELFAGVPGVQNVMQIFARRVAGLGKLPREIVEPRAAARRAADVVVIGAGPSGMAIAAALAKRGRDVEVIDDAVALGGGSTAFAGDEARPWQAIRAAFDASGARARAGTIAGGFYGDELLVAGEGGVEIVTARAAILAPGAHDGVLAFEGNDLPGVMSARAAGWLLARGIVPGAHVVVALVDGGGPFGEAFARAASALGAPCEVTVVRGEPKRARGSSRVKEVVVATSSGDATHAADVLLVDAPRAPAYELCAQAGASLAHEPRGFVVRTDGGKIRDGVWALGEVVGAPLEPSHIVDEAERLARAIGS